MTEEAQCLVNPSRAMFKMQLNAANEVSSPNRVTLSSMEITNMFYAVNSIVGFTDIWGIVNITNSYFHRLKICGAVVKNDFKDIGRPDVLGTINNKYFTDV